MPERTRGGATRLTLGCFEVAGRIYAIDATQLREVVRWQPVTPLPKAPEPIEGVIDLRGVMVPVMDLGRALGGDRLDANEHSRIVVAEVDGLVLGLVVDGTRDVIEVDSTDMIDPPALVAQAGYEATRAVVRRSNGEPILVLSLEHLLETVYRSALDASEAAS
jgi:purine-binding chemotaxis protein CheW